MAFKNKIQMATEAYDKARIKLDETTTACRQARESFNEARALMQEEALKQKEKVAKELKKQLREE